MEHRLTNTNVLTFAEPGGAPDEIGICFDLSDLPAAWGKISPTHIRRDRLNIWLSIAAQDGEHELLLPMDSAVIAESFKNFETVVILGLDDEGDFALEAELSWS